MIDADRVLRPLQEAKPAVDRLESYESPAELTEALRATSHAVERTLRTLLRSDASAPDSIRLTAMSPAEMTTDAVLTELRRRDLISLGLAGRVHELRQAVERAERAEVRAADADNAEDVVRCVRDEVQRLARGRVAAPQADVQREMAEPDYGLAHGYASSADRMAIIRRPRFVAAVAVLILLATAAAVFLFGRSSDMEKGVQAFRDGRKGVAEQHFRSALQDDADNNTARLYLARILREQGRGEEAGQLLRAAVNTDPRDEAVRRELGYLFVQLNRHTAAAEQFRQAVELNAAEPLNWVGLVEALRRAGDPSAAEVERRAPVQAQTMLRERDRRTGGTPPAP